MKASSIFLYLYGADARVVLFPMIVKRLENKEASRDMMADRKSAGYPQIANIPIQLSTRSIMRAQRHRVDAQHERFATFDGVVRPQKASDIAFQGRIRF